MTRAVQDLCTPAQAMYILRQWDNFTTAPSSGSNSNADDDNDDLFERLFSLLGEENASSVRFLLYFMFSIPHNLFYFVYNNRTDAPDVDGPTSDLETVTRRRRRTTCTGKVNTIPITLLSLRLSLFRRCEYYSFIHSFIYQVTYKATVICCLLPLFTH